MLYGGTVAGKDQLVQKCFETYPWKKSVCLYPLSLEARLHAVAKYHEELLQLKQQLQTKQLWTSFMGEFRMNTTSHMIRVLLFF